MVWRSGLAGLALGARFFISSGSSGSRAGGLALGFGRIGARIAFFSSVRAARGAGQVGLQVGPQTYAEPYLTIFAFGSDYFGSTSGAFGQVREIRIEPSTRFWQVRVLGARFVVSTGRSGRFV